MTRLKLHPAEIVLVGSIRMLAADALWWRLV